VAEEVSEREVEMTTLLIKGLSFEGFHGATAAERELAWRFEVDVELESDLERAGRSDRLVDTLDYGSICRTVLEVQSGHTFHLLEALAHAMANALQERFPASGVRLEIRKLAPPRCPGLPEYAAVRLTRPRSGGGSSL
jgi:dihydroneopterin aldolase